MREGEDRFDNREVSAQEVCSMKEQQQGLPKTEEQPLLMYVHVCHDEMRCTLASPALQHK